MHYVAYDYAFFYYAFHSVLHHQVSFRALYDINTQVSWLQRFHYPLNHFNQYVYPPQFAVLFAWLGALPFYLSAVIWMLISALAYFGGLFCLVRLLWPKVRRIHLIALFVLALVVTPFEIDLIAGNVNSILFFTMAFAFYMLYGKNRPRLAGISLGLAVLFKVTPLALLLVFVLRRQWRVFAWTMISIGLGTVLTCFIIGVAPVFQYVLHFLSLGQTSMKNGAAPYNQSIIGVIGMLQSHGWWFGGKAVQDIGYLVFVTLVARTIYSSIRRSNNVDWRLDMSLAGLCPLLFSPLVEEMHLMFAVPALMVFVRLGYEIYSSDHSKNHGSAPWLFFIAGVSTCLLSLPVTFGLNYITAHWPALAWMHVQMFVVLIITYVTVILMYKRSSTMPNGTSDKLTRPPSMGLDKAPIFFPE